jgi:hypothetical protein
MKKISNAEHPTTNIQFSRYAPGVIVCSMFTINQMDEEREEFALRPAHAHKNIGRRSEVSI